MKSPKFKYLSLIITLFLGSMTYVVAQDAPEAEPIAEENAETEIIDLLKKGGNTMYVLGFLSVVGTALVIYNLIAIRSAPFLATKQVEEIGTMVESLDIEGAKALCEENSSPVVNIIGAGLERIQDGEIDQASMEKAVSDASVEELSGAFVFINYLSVIGAIAPMVGLLGTVSGMIKAFRAISTVGMGDPAVLADNISEALITTASGLIVAIPALVAYYYFKNRYGKITSSVNRVVGDVFFKLNLAVRRAHA
ncbi:MAG: MotA/TolQ/ExbB proton channel family protein [Opitutales bacterium]|nr:MotA/TolQ/ExbB proton channel family protein [Opitutales bacterium]NRA26337.1 MotA/TolQ/ExbB proton channel family protein [Opitutales bacterium]